MQFNEEKAIKILTDELCYAYCDNCKNVENIENCDDCHRKYQNWALNENSARYIIDRIIKEATYAI